MRIKELLSGEKLSAEQVSFLAEGVSNKTDYMILNKMEKRMIELHGEEIYTSMSEKIKHVANLILNKDTEEMYAFYSGCLEQYLQANKENNSIGQFNIVFIVLVHITIKALRAT